ncbi:OmpA family protein [Corallococcus macrosporus]|uniref:OmpA/MotB domain protein n=1 Tax=Myxococcus fulvus (strain ATCC BAA-855 / HW-1) TaxID=483219 RepID=F8CQ71_MYXFH|nr:OmpA family protein [Corallococcus macrosporus]AEI64194.1 OmpA/MotB domain protein [Corallococcus macrosporus]
MASVFTLLLGAPRLAAAQGALEPFDLERLSLHPTSAASLTSAAGTLLEPGQLRLAVAAHHERSPLTVWRDDARNGALVSSRSQLHVSAAFAVHRRVELGARLPFLMHQGGEGMTASGLAAPSSTGLGTPWLKARWGLLRQSAGAPLSLAAELGVGLPLGRESALAGKGWNVAPRLSAGRDLGPVLLSLDAGARLRPRSQVGGHSVGSELPWSVSVATTGQGLRGELGVHSAVPLTQGGVTPWEVLAGARYPLGRLELFALGGPGLGAAPGTPAFRVLAGVGLTALGGTRSVTRAPAPLPVAAVEPEPAVQPPVALVAPTPVDVDVDVCAPGQTHTPEQCPDLDDDADGIANRVDRCALAAEDRDDFQDEDGCPELDNDNDAVADAVDNCPTEADPARNQGCPSRQRQLVVITANRLEIKQKVFFATNKATVLPRSNLLLAQVAEVLIRHPELSRVLIEGHTDAKGRADHNRRLSQARAEAVRQKLLDLGVEPTRLLAAGRGPDVPADTNATAKGRDNNRRVEFHLIDAASQPAESTHAAAN